MELEASCPFCALRPYEKSHVALPIDREDVSPCTEWFQGEAAAASDRGVESQGAVYWGGRPTPGIDVYSGSFLTVLESP